MIKGKCNGICNSQRTSNVITATYTHTHTCVVATKCYIYVYVYVKSLLLSTPYATGRAMTVSICIRVGLFGCVCVCCLHQYPQATTSAHIYTPTLWLFSVLTYMVHTWIFNIVSRGYLTVKISRTASIQGELEEQWSRTGPWLMISGNDVSLRLTKFSVIYRLYMVHFHPIRLMWFSVKAIKI